MILSHILEVGGMPLQPKMLMDKNDTVNVAEFSTPNKNKLLNFSGVVRLIIVERYVPVKGFSASASMLNAGAES